eukprot:gene257-60353_t
MNDQGCVMNEGAARAHRAALGDGKEEFTDGKFRLTPHLSHGRQPPMVWLTK